MSQTKPIIKPEPDLDRLMASVREMALHGRTRVPENGTRSTDSSELKSPAHPTVPGPGLPRLDLQPPFEARDDDHYHVDDLLKYHDREFVRNAYRALLKREPEEAEYKSNIECLGAGYFNKIDILASLHHSDEGRRANVRLDGVQVPATFRRAGRIPFVGYFVQLGLAVARLPRLVRHQRQVEAYTFAQQRQIADHLNALTSCWSDLMASHQSELKANIDRISEHMGAQQHHLEIITPRLDALPARIDQLDEKAERLENLTRVLEQQGDLLIQKHDKILDERRKLDEWLASRLAALDVQTRQRAEFLSQLVEVRLNQLSQRLQQLKIDLLLQANRMDSVLEAAKETLRGSPPACGPGALATEAEHSLDSLYALLEEQFRGSREEIKDRLRFYLPFLEKSAITGDILDLGCGRGEWLELLMEKGLSGRGIDINRVLLEQSKKRGLDVVESDVIEYLRELPDESLNAVTSFHLVEHLPFDMLVRVVDEIVRTLRGGGLLVMETPNPENVIVGSYTFYMDPTHLHPLPSPMMKFLLECRGLARVETIGLNAPAGQRVSGSGELIGRFNSLMYAPADYALIAWKT